eukprot:TRINITY_DN1532_c0_g2_i1.p1 TRINITY_DN1532_c0_g2~~TRINITY_DN1532_c0_g2_i1.p1  ORF type:complete len:716 (-),score=132.11 TRINITY_DN1532_c0_g2_i1:1153-3255(-)
MSALVKIRQHCQKRGLTGVIQFGELLQSYDVYHNGTISYVIFVSAVNEFGLKIHEQLLEELIEKFEGSNPSVVHYESVLASVRLTLNSKRRAVVHRAFSWLDQDADNFVSLADLTRLYSARNNREVQSRRLTEQEARAEFTKNIRQFANGEAGLRYEDFERYYESIATCVETDDAFNLVVFNDWQLAERGDRTTITHNPLPPRSPSRQSPVIFSPKAHQSPRTQQSPRPFAGSVMKSLLEQQPQVSLLLPPGAVHASSVSSRSVQDGASISTGAATPSRRRHIAQPVSSVEPDFNDLLQRLRIVLQRRGIRAIFSLEKVFRLQDSKHSKRVSLPQFRRALSDIRSGLQERDMEQLFKIQDRDRDGYIDYEIFLQTLRGPLSERRRQLIHSAFRAVDCTGSGAVELFEVRAAFTAGRHPDVRAARRTESDVLLDFLDTFTDCNADGLVTLPIFERYYSSVSFGITDDASFESILTSSWVMERASSASPPKQSSIMETKRNSQYVGNAGELVGRLKRVLQQRGPDGIPGLSRTLAQHDQHSNGMLSVDMFQRALRASGAPVTTDDVQCLVLLLDPNETGYVDRHEFISLFRTGLSERRRILVAKLFSEIQTEPGATTVDMLKRCRKLERSADGGRISEDQQLRDFIENFTADQDGRISQQSFEEHYENVSASVEDDTEFSWVANGGWAFGNARSRTPRKTLH